MDKNIVVSSPKKVLGGKLANSGMYYCEVHIPYGVGKNNHPIYSNSPTTATDYANKFVEAHLQQKISRIEGYLKEKDIRKRLAEELE